MDDYEPAEFDDAFGFSRQSDTERTSGFRDGKKDLSAFPFGFFSRVV